MKTSIAGTLVFGLLFFVTSSLAFAADPTSQNEQELIAALVSSETPDAEKALICKRLAVYGSAAAVPALEPLLADERLASWARIPLEVIPGDEANQALRKAASTLTGRSLIGIINSLGVRRDVDAVELLEKHLSAEDADVSTAAAVALGRIGDQPAAKVLQSALAEGTDAVRAAAADGLVLCAEHLLAADQKELAIQLYEEVRQADVPKQRQLEATRGAILAQGAAGLPLLVQQLQSDDRDFYAIGLFTAREVQGAEATETLVKLLQEIVPRRQPALLLALADRGDKAALSDVLLLAATGATEARLAALRAVERLGDASCVEPLLNIASEADADIATAATAAIEQLADERVDAVLVERLAKATGKTKVTIINAVGKRRIPAYPALREAAGSGDATIRKAAFMALGNTIELQNLDYLIEQVVAPAHAEDAETAAVALRAAAVRMHDREACAAKLSAALSKASDAAQQSMVKILGEMGGEKALQTLGTVARDGSPELQDTATRLLGEWMTVDGSTELMKLAKRPGKYQIRALRGYIRLARQFLMPAEQRTEMCRAALEVAERDEERKLVLGVLQRYASLENLKLAIDVTKIPSLKAEAVQTVRAIANKIGADSAEVKALLAKAGISLRG